MKKRLLYLLIVLTFFSCGTYPRTQKTAMADGSIYFDETSVPDSLRAFYYYTEGLKAALIYENSGDARAWFGKAIAEDSLFAPAYYQTAELLMEASPGEALPYSRKAEALDSMNVTYRSQLGRALVTSGHLEEALPIYGKLLKEDPHNPLNYRMLAALYDISGQPYTAISILDSAEYRLGRIEELSSQKRQLLMSVRMFDKALEETNALINDYPYDDMNYVIRGDLYRMMGKDSAALANYTEALRIDSTNVGTLGTLADFYQKKRDANNYLVTVKKIFESDDFPKEHKIEVFNDLTSDIRFYGANYFMMNALAGTLLLKYPDDFSILALYGTHLIRSGEIDQALALYKSFSEENHTQKEPYYAIIDIESYLQRPDSVAKYSDKALAQFPKDSELYMRKGFALGNMQRSGEAVEAYKKGLKYAQSDSVKSAMAGIMGDHYHQEGDIKKTYDYYRRALKYNPDNETVLNNYAYYLGEEDRDLEKALEMSGRANELRPGNSTFLDTHAWILYKLGRYEEAKQFMLQAVSLDSSGSDVLFLHYGDILHKLGDDFMARIYWRKALEKGYDAKEIENRLKLTGE